MGGWEEERCVCVWESGRRRGVCAYGRVGGGEVYVCVCVCVCVCVRREEGRGGSQQKLIPNRGEGRRERVHPPE